jgi:hypothetical protein
VDNVAGTIDADEFVERGFVRLRGAFSADLAARCRGLLWQATACDPDDPRTWTAPVVRIGYRDDPPFAEAVNTPALHGAFDRLAGAGRWIPRPNVGTFPIRFPHPDDPGDDGWHIDASFRPEGVDDTDYFRWRINTRSDGKVLLLLLLFSEVGDDDAPTRVRVGSHRSLVPALEPFGEAGADVFDLMPLPEGDVALATGDPGDVYLCHPFLVHAAQPHRGRAPRFLAQPPLHQRRPLDLDRTDGDHSPVEQAIRLGRTGASS